MITSATVPMDSKVDNVNNLTNARNVKLIHAKMEESVHVMEKTVTSADVLRDLKEISVSIKHSHIHCRHATPVQTLLIAQPTQHLVVPVEVVTTAKKKFHVCPNHAKMEAHALILMMVSTAPVL